MRLDPGETIVLRRGFHIIQLVPVLIAAAVLLIFMVVGTTLLTSRGVPAGFPVSAATLSLVLMILAAIGILVALVAIHVFRQNMIVLTTKRYIQILQFGLFNRRESSQTLDHIQDARGARRGFLATILNYGELEIQTAATEENFVFRPVGDPIALADAINEAHLAHGHSIPPEPHAVQNFPHHATNDTGAEYRSSTDEETNHDPQQ